MILPRIFYYFVALFVGFMCWSAALIFVTSCGRGIPPQVIAAQYEAEQIACIEEADATKGVTNEEKLVLSQICRNKVKAKYGRLDGGSHETR